MTWDGEDTSKHKTLANHVNDLMGFIHKKVKEKKEGVRC